MTNTTKNLSTLLALSNDLFEDILTTEVTIPSTGELVSVKGMDNKTEIAFKTSHLSYRSFINKLHKTLYSFTRFNDRDNRPSFNDYADQVSLKDPEVLALHIYDLTYDKTIGKQSISCPCGKNVFEDEIKIEHLINEDSIKYFDKTIETEEGEIKKMDFKDYEYLIEKEIEIPLNKRIGNLENTKSIIYKFYTGIPTLKKYLQIYDIIPDEVLNDRSGNNEQLLDDAEELSVATKRLEVYKRIKTDEMDNEGNDIYKNELVTDVDCDSFDGMNNVYIALKQMPLSLDVLRLKYDEHMQEFIPKFSKKFKCQKIQSGDGEVCGREWDYYVNPLILLHMRFQHKL